MSEPPHGRDNRLARSDVGKFDAETTLAGG